MPPVGSETESVSSDGTKLSLRGLLHYLWDQAELTKWHPGFAGKRTWGTVRRQLLSASEDKFARGDSLRSRLYIPETFFLDQRDAINARRSAQWLQALSAPDRPQRLMLLIGEVKEVVPARFGFKAVVKHVPDQTFALDHQLYLRLGRRFETELALWAASEEMHMVIIATFSVAETVVPVVSELSLMPVTQHWLPVENAFDEQLVDLLVSQGRTFRKGLRYNLPARIPVANATLSDTGGEPCSLRISREAKADTEVRIQTETHQHRPPAPELGLAPAGWGNAPLAQEALFHRNRRPSPVSSKRIMHRILSSTPKESVMGFSASDVVPFTQARSNLSELADQAKAGAEKIITKNGESYVALIDADRLDYYHRLERERIHLLLIDDAKRGRGRYRSRPHL